MSILALIGAFACILAGAAMAVRAFLLGGRVSGWPSGPLALRWALWGAGFVTGAQGVMILKWRLPVEAGECAVYAACAVLSMAYAVNLIRQRSVAHAAAKLASGSLSAA